MRHRKISLVTNSENVCLPNDSRYLVESLVQEPMHPTYDEAVLNGPASPTEPFPSLKVHSLVNLWRFCARSTLLAKRAFRGSH